ncbi:hypothetical protein EQG49_01100 [Periweissella cryptocerci]|uniref:Uncharacterized protein n=1 Tax=Periweissella cryptocerci TaxID=2506420 RepID=A0A4P6YR92_9LACO|nr:hypothetical protein [Periweissella cryptocerci]QBO35148.1 hypothetical protein EQG49_01100 [Periweissella cryptocerci]
MKITHYDDKFYYPDQIVATVELDDKYYMYSDCRARKTLQRVHPAYIPSRTDGISSDTVDFGIDATWQQAMEAFILANVHSADEAYEKGGVTY